MFTVVEGSPYVGRTVYRFSIREDTKTGHITYTKQKGKIVSHKLYYTRNVPKITAEFESVHVSLEPDKLDTIKNGIIISLNPDDKNAVLIYLDAQTKALQETIKRENLLTRRIQFAKDFLKKDTCFEEEVTSKKSVYGQ